MDSLSISPRLPVDELHPVPNLTVEHMQSLDPSFCAAAAAALHSEDVAAATAVAAAMASEAQGASLIPRRILYVNRDVQMQRPREVAKQLQLIAIAATGETDVAFDCAEDGFEALQLYLNTAYCAIIIYSNLRNMSALETLRMAREVSGGHLCPVVLIGHDSSKHGIISHEDESFLTNVYADTESDPFLGENLLMVFQQILCPQLNLAASSFSSSGSLSSSSSSSSSSRTYTKSGAVVSV